MWLDRLLLYCSRETVTRTLKTVKAMNAVITYKTCYDIINKYIRVLLPILLLRRCSDVGCFLCAVVGYNNIAIEK